MFFSVIPPAIHLKISPRFFFLRIRSASQSGTNCRIDNLNMPSLISGWVSSSNFNWVIYQVFHLGIHLLFPSRDSSRNSNLWFTPGMPARHSFIPWVTSRNSICRSLFDFFQESLLRDSSRNWSFSKKFLLGIPSWMPYADSSEFFFLRDFSRKSIRSSFKVNI